MKPLTLRLKINGALLATCLAALGLYAAVLYPYQMQQRQQRLDRVEHLLHSVYEQKRTSLANEIFTRKELALQDTLHDTLQARNMVAAEVFDAAGWPLMRAVQEGGRPPELKQPSGDASLFTILQEHDLACYTTPVTLYGELAGYLRLTYDVSYLSRESRTSLLFFLTLTVAALGLLAGLLNLLLTRSVINPLRKLQQGLRAVQAGRLGERVEWPSSDESGQMIQAFNDMSQALLEAVTAKDEYASRLQAINEELSRSRESYRSLFENALEGMFRTTKDGKFITANPAMARMLGFDSTQQLLDEVTRTGEQIWRRREDRERFWAEVQQHGAVADMLVEGERRDGSTIWGLLSGRIIPPGEQDAGCLEGALVDVTARVEAEQELQSYKESLEELVQRRTAELEESRRRLFTLMASLPGMAYRCRLDELRTMEFVSQGALNLTGRHPFGLTGNLTQAYGRLIHPEDRERVLETIRLAAESDRPFQVIYRIRAGGDSLKWVWEQGRTLFRSSNAERVAEGFVIDITEQERAKQVLAESESRYRAMFYNNRAVKLLVDPADGRIIQANTAACDFYGFSQERITAMRLADVEASSGENLWAKLSKTDEDDEGLLASSIHRTSAGELRHVEMAVTPLELHGRTLLYCLVLDVTERRLAEEQLHAAKEELEEHARDLAEAKERAESATKAKSQFLANMSHEIKTPLNAIVGFTGLALQLQSDPRIALYLDKIQASSKILLRLVDDILDFSRIEAGKLTLTADTVSLHEVLSQTADLLSASAHRKGLEFVIDAADAEQGVHGDGLRLTQVLTNLASNAVKFTDSGEVVIRVDSEPVDEDRLLLSFLVRDTGCGLDPEQVENLFEAFTQADGSSTRRYGGAGLGLALSRRLAALMDGAIEVESKPGQGATFRFTARLPRAELPEGSAGTAPVAGLERPVLLVEDVPSAQRAALRILEGIGLETEVAESGEACLQALRNWPEAKPPPVLLLDATLPDHTPRSLAREIAEAGLAVSGLVLAGPLAQRDRELDAANACLPGVPADYAPKPLLSTSLARILADLANPAPPARPKNPQPPSAQASRVLIVEDHDVSREIAEAFARQAGFDVHSAGDGRQALDMLDRSRHSGRPFHTVLLDIQMPVMDGFETLQRIRSDHRFHDLRVVIATAHDQDEDIRRCKEAGADDHVGKPLHAENLAAVLAGGRTTQPPHSPTPTKSDPDAVLDQQAAMKRLRGNASLYQRLLEDFTAAYGQTPGEIQRLLDEDRLDEAGRIMHSLKSAAGNIGAGQLLETAQAVEREIRAGRHPAAAMLDGLDSALQAALDAAERGQAVPKKEDGEREPDLLAAARRLRELEELARNNNIRAEASFRSLKRCLGPWADAPELERVGACLARFDFKGALEAITAAAEKLFPEESEEQSDQESSSNGCEG
jgi:PAS domain S-box-containing protein